MLLALTAAVLASSTCGLTDLSVAADLQAVAMVRPRPPIPGGMRRGGGPRGPRFGGQGGYRPYEAYTAPTEEAPVEEAPVEEAPIEEAPVEEAPASSASGDDDVPYFYQYANAYSPGASCQNTSVAMVLKHFGVDITPDEVTATFGKDKAQSPHGLAEVFNHFAAKAGIPERLDPVTDGSLEDFRRAVQGDDPVIVHGWMTGPGHVVVATDYDGSSYTVNDPGGRWSQGWKSSGYGTSSTAGDGVSYGASAFEQAVSTSDGYTFDPMWFHRVVRP